MKFTSLKQKLIVRTMVTLLLVFGMILVSIVFFSYYTTQESSDKTRRIMEDKLIEKGRLLVTTNGLAFKGYIRDNSISDIPLIIKEAVSGDPDIMYGIVTMTGFPMAVLVDADNVDDLESRAGVEVDSLQDDELYKWTIGLKEFSKKPDEKGIIHFASPVFSDEEGAVIGTVRYGLTTEPLNTRLAEIQEEFMDQLFDSIVVFAVLGGLSLLVGLFLMRQQAVTITQPLGDLTEAADTIAKGDLSIEVQVSSGDEVERLADSFNKMARDLTLSYERLKAQNKELEAAKTELADLNKHLEEKVQERTAQLQESESKFRALFEESADAILLGTEERFLDCNRAMLEMMRCKSKEELLALGPDEISPKTQPDGSDSEQRLAQIYEKALSSGSQHFEWVHKRADGERFFAEIVLTAFPLHGKQVLHKVFRDITERKKTEEKLRDTQDKLVKSAHQAGMAEIATGVLHNIGNILNSVNISIEEISQALNNSKLKGFLKANELVKMHLEDIGNYFANDEKGRLIPGYYVSLGEAIKSEHELMAEESESLSKKITIMRDVISTQQNYAKTSLYTENVEIASLLEDALKFQLVSLNRQGVKIIKDYQRIPKGNVSKIKLVHVFTNLIKNAREAMAQNDIENKTQELRLIIRMLEDNKNVEVQVSDNGSGIDQENLDKIFNHGFTTKRNGHGFGLHTCANFMTEMNGHLSAGSNGVGEGAVFTVTFPLNAKDTLD